MKGLRTVLEELIRYQKVACSPDCNAKQGIERVSLDKAISEIEGMVPEKKIWDISMLEDEYNVSEGWNACRQAILTNFRGGE